MTARKETIDETRRRLASPEWRRHEREGHVVGVLLLVLPFLLASAFSAAGLRPVGLMLSAVPLVVVPAVLWSAGPRFGFDRRAAVLVAVPVLGVLYVVGWAATSQVMVMLSTTPAMSAHNLMSSPGCLAYGLLDLSRNVPCTWTSKETATAWKNPAWR